eukprot:SAG31_NODE_20193_length_581_cov_1.122407_2_plen_113_part_01
MFEEDIDAFDDTGAINDYTEAEIDTADFIRGVGDAAAAEVAEGLLQLEQSAPPLARRDEVDSAEVDQVEEAQARFYFCRDKVPEPSFQALSRKGNIIFATTDVHKESYHGIGS